MKVGRLITLLERFEKDEDVIIKLELTNKNHKEYQEKIYQIDSIEYSSKTNIVSLVSEEKI